MHEKFMIQRTRSKRRLNRCRTYRCRLPDRFNRTGIAQSLLNLLVESTLDKELGEK